MLNRFRKERNSTIKQQEEQINNNDLENDSSISFHEDNDVHYYDLDYSDQNINDGLVSSSDQNQRQITHEEFMQMIAINEQKKHPDFSQSQSDESLPQQQSHYRQRRQQYYQRQNKEKNIHSNDFKQHQKNKFTPSTRDKSQQLYSYGLKNINIIQKNDPQKSSGTRNQVKFSKENSFNTENSVRQFRIDSLLNVRAIQKQQRKSQRIQSSKNDLYKSEQQDQSFSLITLPEYDEETYSSIKSRQNIQLSKEREQKKRRMSKYRNIAKLRTQQDENKYEKLNWRYQEAKLKFMDNFLPDSMKIGSNSYNMFKYMNKKQQMNLNLLFI